METKAEKVLNFLHIVSLSALVLPVNIEEVALMRNKKIKYDEVWVRKKRINGSSFHFNPTTPER